MAKLPMGAKILSPSRDRTFKVLLTHVRAKQVLMDIISTVIEKEVLDVRILNNEIPTMDVDEKAERFDVNCVINDNNEQVNVEMHFSKRKKEVGIKRTGFINKYSYYVTDLHSSQPGIGKEYTQLVRTYQITFCSNIIFSKREDFKTWFSLRAKDGEQIQLSDQVNIIIIELGKLEKVLDKPVEEMTSIEKWSIFLKYASNSQFTHHRQNRYLYL